MFKKLFQWLFGECDGCKVLREQNEYLRKQNNSLLLARGVQPVFTEKEAEQTEDEKKQQAIFENAELVMGGD